MLQGYDDDDNDNDHRHRRDGDTGYEVKISGGAEDFDPEEGLSDCYAAKASRLLSAERLAERKQALEEQGRRILRRRRAAAGAPPLTRRFPYLHLFLLGGGTGDTKAAHRTDGSAQGRDGGGERTSPAA